MSNDKQADGPDSAGSTGETQPRSLELPSYDPPSLPTAPIGPTPSATADPNPVAAQDGTLNAPPPREAPFPAPLPRRQVPLAEMPPPAVNTETIVLIDEPESRSGSKRVFWALGGVALLALVLFLADWTIRNIETMQLLTQIEKSEAAMVAFQNGTAALELPDTSPNGEPDADLAEDFAAEVEALAKTSAAAVAAAGNDVAEVSFLPWHGSLVDAQAVYLTHNQAWVAYLTAGSKQATVLFEPNSALQTDIGTTWEASEIAVRAAVPTPAFPGIADRVDAIFAEEGDSGSSGLQASAR